MQEARRFNTRGFVTLTVALSGLSLPISGLANHVLGFELSVARHAWMSAHNSLGVVFVAFSIWHIALNRRPLWSHLRHASVQAVGVSREALAALAVISAALLFVGHAFLVR